MAGPLFSHLAAFASGGDVPAGGQRSALSSHPAGTTFDAAHSSLGALASVEAGSPKPPRRVGRGVGLPAPRPVRHLIARRQQVAAVRAEDRAVREARWGDGGRS